MMNAESAIKSHFHYVNESDYAKPFSELKVDSFDLVEFRVILEHQTGRRIPDEQWTKFKSLAEIINHFDTENTDGKKVERLSNGVAFERRYSISMPNMNAGGLSENWLFKEIGDLHWEMICDGLDTRSSALSDELGNRLYATFTRVRIDCSDGLRSFEENDSLTIRGDITRFGAGIFFSETTAVSEDRSISANVMSSFSKRGDVSNTALLKGQPAVPDDCPIAECAVMPPFGTEYKAIRSEEHGNTIFETTYVVNPYYDINGVGLLYFASYPVINDVCESAYMNGLTNDSRHWVERSTLKLRDVSYFGNCDIGEEIVYRLHEVVNTDDRVTLVSSLSRKSDGMRMATVFTEKQRED